MTDPNLAAPSPNEQPPAPPRKKRRWLKVLVALVAMIVLLVVLLPTIFSLGPVRSLVVSQASGYINGKLDIQSWSFGWFSPVRIEGVKVYDKQNALVLEADKIETEATLLSLARQNFNVGKTTIAANATRIVVYPDGRTNLHDVFNLPASQPGAKPEPTAPAGETAIPDVKIDLTLDLRGAVELVDANSKTLSTLQLRQGSGGTIKIDDINAGVNSDLKLIYDVDNRPASTISVAGNVDAVQNNKLDLANLAAQLKIALASVDLGASKPFLAMAGLTGTEIDGLANGEIIADIQPGQSGGAKGEIQIAQTRFACPAIQDVYQARLIRIPIDVSRVSENGASRIKLNIQTILPEATAAITGDLPEQALRNLSEQRMPGADGNLSIILTAQPAKVAQAFPRTLKLGDGVQVSGGEVFGKFDIWLKSQPQNSIVYSLSTKISAAGTREGKAIAIAPIDVAAVGTLNDLADPIRGLRDLSVKLASDFATFRADGASVTDMQGAGSADLDKLRAQLAQFADLKDVALAGKADLSVKNKLKDQAAGLYALELGGTLTGIKLRLPNLPPLDLQFVQAGVNSDYALDLNAPRPFKEVRSAAVSLLIGPSRDKPLVEGQAAISQFDPDALTIRQFDVQRATITDLAQLQKLIDPFVPQLRARKIELQNGAVYLVTKGSADLKKMSIVLDDLQASVPGLRVAMDGKELLNEKKIALAIAGKIEAGEQTIVDLSKLSFDSSIASLTKTDAPLKVTLAPNAPLPRGNARLEVSANFVPLNRIVRALSPSTTSTVTGGTLAGTLIIAGEANRSSANFSGKIGGLSIDQTAIDDTTIALDAIATDSLDRVSASGSVKGFVALTLKDTTVNLAAGTPLLKMVESAALQIGVPDAQKVTILARSLVPGLNLPYTPSAGVAISANIKGGVADLDIKASRVSLRDEATKKTFAFDPKKPISIVARIEAAGADKIEKITVSKLDADVDVAKLTALEPIVIDDPLGTPVPVARIEVAGSLDRLTPLLQFLQNADKPLPYRGLFVVRSTVTSRQGEITAKLDGSVRDLSILDEQNKPVFTEKEVKIAGDLSANLESQIARINTLSIDMASSKAATINVTGAVKQFSTNAPAFENVVVKLDAKGEQAWPIVFPLLPPEQQVSLKNAKITGPIAFNVTANGAYLLDKPLNEAVKPLSAVGQIVVSAADLYESYGIDVRNLQQLFTLEKGQLITGHRNEQGKFVFAPPFDINSGKGSFGSVVINLGHPDMLVSIGRKQKLLTGVQLNPVMAAQLGSLASVFFKDSKEATGLVDVTVIDCTNVPLADLMAGSKKAKAAVLYSIRNLRIDGPVPSALSSALGWGQQGIVGNIENGSLALVDGVAYQDMTLGIARTVDQVDRATGQSKKVEVLEPIQFKGGIDLQKQKFKDYSMFISSELLPKRWRNSFAKGTTVELKGDVGDTWGVIGQAIGSLAIQGEGGNLIEDLLNQNKKKSKGK